MFLVLDNNYYDYIIAGSGIAGNVCAYLLASKKNNCLILERHSHRGEKICGGGFSYKALRLLEKANIDVNNLRTLEHKDIIGHVCFANKNIFEKKYTLGKISMGIQRKLADDFLLNQAIQHGAIIFYDTPVKTVRHEKNLFIVNEKFSTKNFIVATGAYGLKPYVPVGQSFGMSMLIQGQSRLDDDKFYYWYYGEDDSKYCWKFPIGNDLWNIGIWQRNLNSDIKADFQSWLEKIESEYFHSGFDCLTKLRGSYLGNVDQRDNRNFSCGIGDFAGHNNIRNGGGIIGAVKSAIEVAKNLAFAREC